MNDKDLIDRLTAERDRHLTALRRIATLEPTRGKKACIRSALVHVQSIAAAELVAPVKLGIDSYDGKS
jgi:hypothetical protein